MLHLASKRKAGPLLYLNTGKKSKKSICKSNEKNEGEDKNLINYSKPVTNRYEKKSSKRYSKKRKNNKRKITKKHSIDICDGFKSPMKMSKYETNEQQSRELIPPTIFAVPLKNNLEKPETREKMVSPEDVKNLMFEFNRIVTNVDTEIKGTQTLPMSPVKKFKFDKHTLINESLSPTTPITPMSPTTPTTPMTRVQWNNYKRKFQEIKKQLDHSNKINDDLKSSINFIKIGCELRFIANEFSKQFQENSSPNNINITSVKSDTDIDMGTEV